MDLKAIFSIIIIFFIVIMSDKILIKRNKKYLHIILVLIFICLGISIELNFTNNFLGIDQRIFIRVATVILFSSYISTFRLDKFRMRIDNTILIFILISMICFYDISHMYSITNYIYIFIMYISILIIGGIYRNNNGFDFEKIFDFFNFISIANGILGILQFITGYMLIPGAFNTSINYGSGYDQVRRVVGFTGTNNGGGNFSAILFSVIFFNFLRKRRKIDLIALLFTILFSIMTLTRIGYLAIVVEIVIYFIFSKWNTINSIIKRITIIISSLFASVFVTLVFGQKIYDTLFLKRGNTTKWRSIQFDRIFDIIVPNNSFFKGIGPGQYINYAQYNLGYYDINVHSQYINILAEQGVFIFILFILMNIYIFIRAFSNSQNLTEKAFVLSLFLGNLICCNYNPNQYYLINNYVYYILIYAFMYKNKLN